MDEDQNLKELYSEISDHAYMRGRLLNPVYWSQECSNHIGKVRIMIQIQLKQISYPERNN